MERSSDDEEEAEEDDDVELSKVPLGNVKKWLPLLTSDYDAAFIAGKIRNRWNNPSAESTKNLQNLQDLLECLSDVPYVWEDGQRLAGWVERYVAATVINAEMTRKEANETLENFMKKREVGFTKAMAETRAKVAKHADTAAQKKKAWEKKRMKCRNCNKLGHKAADCRAPKNGDKGRK